MVKKVVCIAALVGSAVLAGCSSPCDALADVCKRCGDSALKTSCETAVSSYRAVPLTGNSACQAVLDAKTYDSCK